MQISQTLPPLSLSGNLSDLILNTGAGEVVTVKLQIGNKLLINEIYRPNASGQIKIGYKYVIENVLALQIPDFATLIFNQSNACVDFTINLSSTSGETDQVNFRVIKGHVDSDQVNTNVFFKTSFLTWQPQVKYVQYYDPQWLTYYAADACKIKISAYCAPSKTTIVKTLSDLPAGQLSTININHGLIQELFAVEGIPVYYDIYIEKDGVRLSYVQRFILSQEEFDFNDLFVFENSLGGIDTIRFTGQATHKPNYEFDNAWFDELNLDYEVRPDYVVEKNSGYFRSDEEKIWSLDFFGSLLKYKAESGSLLRIYTMDPNLSSVKGELAAYTFNYSFSKKDDAMNLCRTFEAPPALELPSDIVGESLDLAPRINHYPWAASTDVIIPVQYPYESVWRKLSLRQVIASIVIGTTPDDPDGSNNGIFGIWTDLKNKHASIVTEDLLLQFKTDCPTSATQVITYLEGQFFIDPAFINTEILLGIIPEGNRPPKKLIKFFITANIEMFLTVDTNGEVRILSKDGKNLPTGTELKDKYFINQFFKPSKAEQVRYNPKWILDPSASYCELAETIYVWGKIFEENIQDTGSGTAVADIFLRTYKGTSSPPADYSQPQNCSSTFGVGYTLADPQYPGTNNYNVSMANQNTIRLAAPGTDRYNPYYPKQAIRVQDSYLNGGIASAWYHFSGAAKDTWRLLQTISASGYTGNQINPKLMKVSDDENEYPLDANNDLCIITGLPQAIMDNPVNAPNYRVLNLTACPI